ncbi:UDP-glucose 4-epimerase GalE [Candidatus Woesebacteria bacterium]|nr:UDP-glucose 4-epimerase GalE [Candidatus Woesebacteria bacterium]
MKKRIFVAGGAGYIGSVVTNELLKSNYQVTVYDNLSKGHKSSIPKNAKFIKGDILDRRKLERTFKETRYDAIILFAGRIEVGVSMEDPGVFYLNNVVGSFTLVETAIANGIKKIVFSSSAGVYASKDTPLVETDLIGPASVYGHTKRITEEVLSWYNKTLGLRYAALRYFNAAGATPPDRGEAHQPETHLIPLVLQVALGQRKNIKIFGNDYPTPDGTCVRDYIHVLDLASAHILALKALDKQDNLVCNLGNGEGYSVKEVIETAREVCKHEIKAIVAPRRPGDNAILVANASKAKKILGWKPNVPDLKDIISSAWEWHKSHPKGY